MVGGHRRGSPARGSSPEDSSGENRPRAFSALVGRAPRNPRRRVPACAQLSQPSVRPPSREATGGSNSGAHPEQSPVPSLAGAGSPPRRQHPRRQAAPSAPSPERGAEARRRLEFGDATPAQALQAAQLLLRHPPIPAQDGTPAAPLWPPRVRRPPPVGSGTVSCVRTNPLLGGSEGRLEVPGPASRRKIQPSRRRPLAPGAAAGARGRRRIPRRAASAARISAPPSSGSVSCAEGRNRSRTKRPPVPRPGAHAAGPPSAGARVLVQP